MAKRTKSDCVPKCAVRRADTVLADGEATGHSHRASGGGAVLYDLPGGVRLLDAPTSCPVDHEEHRTINLPAGLYDVTKVLEYSHFDEEARAVAD